jgi:hypothetical protein
VAEKEFCYGNWRGDNSVSLYCTRPVPHAAHEVDPDDDEWDDE